MAAGAVTRAAGALEYGCGYVWTTAQTFIVSEQVTVHARRVDDVMKQHFEVLFGTAIIVSLFMAPLAFPCAAAGGYWAYDKQITNLTGESLFQLSSPLNHELRNVICVIVAIMLHLIFGVEIYATIAFLVGCAIKRMMLLATGPAPLLVMPAQRPANADAAIQAGAPGILPEVR